MFWGPPIWTTGHILAKTYTPDRRREFELFWEILPTLLPCKVCGEHFLEELAVEPLAGVLDSNPSAEEVYQWSSRLHTRVNDRRPFLPPPGSQFDLDVMSKWFSDSIEEPFTAAGVNAPPAKKCMSCRR